MDIIISEVRKSQVRQSQVRQSNKAITLDNVKLDKLWSQVGHSHVRQFQLGQSQVRQFVQTDMDKANKSALDSSPLDFVPFPFFLWLIITLYSFVLVHVFFSILYFFITITISLACH